MLSEKDNISRRNFLKVITVLGLTSCAPFYTRTRFLKLITNDPHPEQYNPILDNLIEIILPFEHPEFPSISALDVRKYLELIFPLTEEPQESLQRAFMIFNDIQLFKEKLTPIIREEKNILEGFEELEKDVINKRVKTFQNNDEKLFKIFEHKLGKQTSFIKAPKQIQTEYFILWGQSSFTIKRMFYNSVKNLINACCYSQKEMWDKIGYAGHFNPKSEK